MINSSPDRIQGPLKSNSLSMSQQPPLEDVLEEIPAQEEEDDEKEGGENEDDEKAMEMILREHERDNHDQTTAP